MSKLIALINEHENEIIFDNMRALVDSVEKYISHLSESPVGARKPEFVQGMLEIKLYLDGYISEFTPDKEEN